MRLNQVTVTVPDLDAAWRFYILLGLLPIVDARPRYARFACPEGGEHLLLAPGRGQGGGTTVHFECEDLDRQVDRLRAAGFTSASGPEDKPWLWRKAELRDPGGNRVVLYFAGANRLDPPWRLRT